MCNGDFNHPETESENQVRIHAWAVYLCKAEKWGHCDELC